MDHPDDFKMEIKNGPQAVKQSVLKKLVCYVCDGTEFRYDHCKVLCLRCGCIIENCSGD
jgi:hypothetical protein